MPVIPRPFHAIPYGVAFSIQFTGALLSQTGSYNVSAAEAGNAAPTDADVINVANAVVGWISNVGPPSSLWAPQAHAVQIRAWSLAVQGGPEYSLAIDMAGTSGDNLIEAVSLEVKLETDIHARGKFGRWFWVAPDLGEVGSDGLWKDAYATAVAGSLFSLGTALGGAGYPHRVASQKYGILYPITSYVPNRILSFQTRRNFGRD